MFIWRKAVGIGKIDALAQQTILRDAINFLQATPLRGLQNSQIDVKRRGLAQSPLKSNFHKLRAGNNAVNADTDEPCCLVTSLRRERGKLSV